MEKQVTRTPPWYLVLGGGGGIDIGSVGQYNILEYSLNSHNYATFISSGKYCIGGRIAGDCQGGHICWGGRDRPNPNATYEEPSGLCPKGFYCPAGKVMKLFHAQLK